MAALVPASARAQMWVDIGMGRSSYDAIAPQLDTENASLGFRYSGVNWIELVAGIPLGTSGGAWGSAAAGGRWHVGSNPSFGLAGSGQLFVVNGSAEAGLAGRGGVLEVSPLVRFDTGIADVEFRTGMLAVWSHYEGDGDVWWVPSTWLEAATWLTPEARLEATGRLVSVAGERFGFGGVATSYDAARWGAWARVGRWFPSPGYAVEWSLGGHLEATARFQLFASVHQEAEDPVYATSASLTWSLGLGVALRRPNRIDPQSLPFELFPRSMVFRLDRDESVGVPSIAGDFTGWSPHPMRPTADGWEAPFELAPGTYHFGFLDGEGVWFLPESVVHRVADGFGGENGVVVIR